MVIFPKIPESSHSKQNFRGVRGIRRPASSTNFSVTSFFCVKLSEEVFFYLNVVGEAAINKI